MRDLESIRSIDEGPRVMVLAAFEYAMHVSFCEQNKSHGQTNVLLSLSIVLPCTMAFVVFLLATSMNIYRHEIDGAVVMISNHEDAET